MNSTSRSKRTMALAVTSAMGAVLLSGCATQGGVFSGLGNGTAEAPVSKTGPDRTVAAAEAAVAAEPRNAAYRAMLGAAYLEAGRFSSAVTSFDDAITLGDKSAGTALRIALALTGEGKHAEAVAVLNDWADVIAPSDLGLAYALAGQPSRGITLMADAIRAGDNSAKTRQNLAYALALNGSWKEAKIMAAQDVPADKLAARLQEWSRMSAPGASQQRVAALLGAPASVVDPGQPVHLALSNTPSIEQLAAEVAAVAAAQPISEPAARPVPAELPAVAEVRPAPLPLEIEPEQPESSSSFETAFAAMTTASETVAHATMDAVKFIQQPIVQALSQRAQAVPAPTAPARSGSAKAPAARGVPEASARAAAAFKADGGYLVQLGSFGSEQSARRAWAIYAKRYPELASHEMVITEAVVSGKHYWRVSAGGFDNAGSRAMCGRVKGRGDGCFAYAEGRPLPGAVDTGVRLARR